MKRGEIRLCELAPPDKRRPVLILSRDATLKLLRTAVVAPITTSIRGLPSEVRLGIEHGLKTESAVNLDHVFRVEKTRLGAFVGSLDADVLRNVCRALNIALGCV